MLVVLNVPMVGIWVKLLRIPFRFLFPFALLFICVGVCSTNNEMFGVIQALAIGIVGYELLRLGFHPAPRPARLRVGTALGSDAGVWRTRDPSGNDAPWSDQ